MAPPAAIKQPTLAPTVAVAAICVVALATLGLVFGRPDVVALAIPIALCALGPLLSRRAFTVKLLADADAVSTTQRPTATIAVDSTADFVQLSLTQADTHTTQLAVAPEGRIKASTRLLHSGPARLVSVVSRGLSHDGALVSAVTPRQVIDWQAMPASRPLPRLPLAPRLTGLHGGHDGSRPGYGGDFRDIHPFTPGDELRRVDWKATARAARGQGELMVRRTNTLSDASVVIVLDNVDELGEAVASWGTGDLERSGITSLDLAREAARSFAEATAAAGDRISYHEITPGGRSVRSGSGQRHLARVLAAIAATGPGAEETMIRRTPAIPPGSVVYVLSTFLDGAAARLALTWRASGHRVVAVDCLPVPDRERLTQRQELALRIVLAERVTMFESLSRAGVDSLAWSEDPEQVAVSLRLAARIRR